MEYGHDKAPRKKLFDWTVSFGNLLTITVLMIGGLVGYGRLEAKVEQISREFEEHKVMQQAQIQDLVRKDVQETRNSFIDRQLADIQTKLDKILQLVR